MLQSAIYADLHVKGFATPASVFHTLGRRTVEKSSFARLANWGRSLLLRDELTNLNGHLLRDVGLCDHSAD